MLVGCPDPLIEERGNTPDRLPKPEIKINNNEFIDKIRIKVTLYYGTTIRFNIHRADSEFGSFKLIGSPTDAAFDDIDIIGAKYYYYKVTVISSESGESYASDIVQTYAKISRPIISATINNSNKIIVSWSPIQHANYYTVTIDNDENSSNGELNRIITSSSPYIDNSVPKGSGNYYRVTAHCTNPITSFTSYNKWGYRPN